MNKQTEIMHIVTTMSNTQVTNCRGLNLQSAAKDLLEIANFKRSKIEILEIPLNQDNQVAIIFALKEMEYVYELFAGIGLNNQFYFTLAVYLYDNQTKQINFDHIVEEINLLSPPTLKVGKVYRLENTASKLYCFSIKDKASNKAILQNMMTGWTMLCHDIKFAPDGSISWSHSTGGYFERG